MGQLVRLGGLALTIALPVAALGEEQERPIATVENAFFEVVGRDQGSVSFMNDLSEQVAEVGFRLMRQPVRRMPRRVLIQLRNAANLNFEGDYLITLKERGFVTLTLKWRHDLPLENTIYGVARAFFIQYTYSILGPSFPSQMRAWPVSLLSSLTYLRLRPAQTQTFMEAMRAGELPSLQAVLEERLLAVSARETDRRGYWLWLVLRREFGIAAADLAGFMRAALRGESIEPRLEEIIRLADDAPPLEEWWRQGLATEAQRSYARFASMDVSRQWIRALASFDRMKGLEGLEDGISADLRRLWELRRNEALRVALQARVELIRSGMQRINPAYFNSAQALGALYETVLESDHSYEFIGALTFFLNDFDDMQRLHETLKAALSGE